MSQHDLLRLLESLRSANGLELVREVAERLPQELIEAEASARIGAERGEHADTRTTWRNGHREKTVTMQAGDLELAIPKLRAGSFFPSLLERRRRIDQALYAVVMEAYVHGVSTLPQALGSSPSYRGEVPPEQGRPHWSTTSSRPSAPTPGYPKVRSP
ncbi:transposase [Streptomyces pratens]|uniref:transposase n=1 Tax=Streptomyces pratens TaxID=887456 RepID=UPI003617C88B